MPNEPTPNELEKLRTLQEDGLTTASEESQKLLQENPLRYNSSASHSYRSIFTTTGSSVVSQIGRRADLEAKQIIGQCENAYREVGIIRNVIDLMSDFASEDLSIIHSVPSIQRFWDAWARKIRLQKIAREGALAFYKYGNFLLYKFYSVVRRKTIQDMKQVTSDLNKQGILDTDKYINAQDDFKPREIPIKYSVISPYAFNIQSNDLMGNPVISYAFSADDLAKIKGKAKKISKLEQEIINNLPSELVRNIKKGDTDFVLDSNYYWLFQYKKAPGRNWSDPLIWAIMEDLKYRKTLRQMDISIAESVINAITIFKLGNTKDGFPATPNAFKKLASLLKTPTTIKNLIWGDLIDVDIFTLPVDRMLSDSKYQQVKDDILSGLGVSQVLVNGAGSNYANSFLSVKTLIERLEEWRTEFTDFIINEITQISEAMGFAQLPIITWGEMNLRDEAAEKRIIIELFDRGVLSYQTVLNKLGENFKIELERFKREEKIREKIPGALQPRGPYINPDDDMTLNEGGRPPGEGDSTTRKQKVKRNTKPKGMDTVASTIACECSDCDVCFEDMANNFSINPDILDKAKSLLRQTSDICTSKYLQSIKKPYVKSLTKEEKQLLDDMIELIYSNLSLQDSIVDETKCISLVTSGAKLERCVKQVYESLVKRYKQKNGTAPSKDKRDELRSSAWGICKSRGLH